MYAVMTNRYSIHRTSTQTISNHDDNPRSWIKFKADIAISSWKHTQKYHKCFPKIVSDRESFYYFDSIDVTLL